MIYARKYDAGENNYMMCIGCGHFVTFFYRINMGTDTFLLCRNCKKELLQSLNIADSENTIFADPEDFHYD